MDRKHVSLGAQAAQLQRSIQNREQRRNAEKHQRHEALEAAGEYSVYDAPGAKRQATGGGAVARLSELTALASQAPAEVFRCELCQANFPSQAGLQQHVAGPVHRKALERQAQEALAAQRRAPYQHMMESALGAAAWSAGHGGGAGGGGGGWPGAGGRGGQPAGGGGRGGGRDGGRGGRGGRGAQDAAPAGPRTDVVSHEAMVAAATKNTDEPLTIDGWAPPTISVPKAPAPTAPPAAAASGGGGAGGAAAAGSSEGRRNAAAAAPSMQAGAGKDGGSGKAGQADGQDGDHDGPGLPGLLGLGYGSDEEEGQEQGQEQAGVGGEEGKQGAGGKGGGPDGSDDSEDEDEEEGKPFTGSFF
ncbi:hypothetical protein HYH02_010526 [Chlamydomonas schloesseri]|uniref:C2H2-type domain-containing protein n=1 Tax=Chlamydomonas schloesseri TaxID=2026947 RepID=A0A835TK00_9CHLO|nr:hypothetical protein HYH02_010526 [Chlamydomonas schloesseri]|eukprot:KAG2439896.1 hypothetical protein HYH02_010526 [Chlamydomonas schloesseri]